MEVFKKLLDETPVTDVLKPGQQVVLLEHNQTISDALQTLARHEILSAPLVMMPNIEEMSMDIDESSMSPTLIGYLDIADILHAFLEYLAQAGKDLSNFKMLAMMTMLEEEGRAFADKLLVTIRGQEDRSLMFQADAGNTSVATSIRDYFLPLNNGQPTVVHRLALFEQHGEITGVISQMDVIRWLLSKIDEYASVADKSIDELGLLTGKPPVLTVNAHTPALLAYSAIAQANVSGAPVVADNEELIANISISDLRCLTSEHFGSLALPSAEFLALEHRTTYLGYSSKSSAYANHTFFASNRKGTPTKGDIQLFTVKRETTLRELLTKFVSEHIHRVYLMTDDFKVEAVITLTDVLRMVGGVW